MAVDAKDRDPRRWRQDAMTETLASERSVFEQHLEEWRADKVGQFVLIKGAEVIGFYPTVGEATTDGFRRFGLEDFFVDQIRPNTITNVTFLGRHVYQVHRSR
jgi:hypothetical protein